MDPVFIGIIIYVTITSIVGMVSCWALWCDNSPINALLAGIIGLLVGPIIPIFLTIIVILGILGSPCYFIGKRSAVVEVNEKDYQAIEDV